MTSLVVPAPAKVNLFLHVTGRRADGYHTLESLFALIDLADTVTLARRDDGAIVRPGSVAGVAEEDDLAVRAARALKQATSTSFGVTIALDKRIPLGAGLGGGSSDAASVLLGLNRLWELGLPRARLARDRGDAGGGRAVLRRRRAGARARHRRRAHPHDAAGSLDRARIAARACAHRRDLRGTGIDTIDCVGENRRLFRELRQERSRVRGAVEVSCGRGGHRSAVAGQSACAHDGIGCMCVRDVRDATRGARCVVAVAAAHRRTSCPHTRASPACGLCDVTAGGPDDEPQRTQRSEKPVSAGESPSGKAPDFDSGIRRFDPYLPSHRLIAVHSPPTRAAFFLRVFG